MSRLQISLARGELLRYVESICNLTSEELVLEIKKQSSLHGEPKDNEIIKKLITWKIERTLPK